MKCPRDETALSGTLANLNGAQACRTCSGFWLPKEQLAGRLDSESLRRLFYDQGGRITTLRCPQDGSLLWERDIGGVLIDRCNACRGLWFDAGELQTVFGKLHLTERSHHPKNSSSSDNSVLDAFTNGGEGASELVGVVLEFIVSAVAE